MLVSWDIFKNFVQVRCLSIQWVELDRSYSLVAIDGPFRLECSVDKDTDECVDFETNFKIIGNKSFSDIDGTPVSRLKATKRGWIYAMVSIECATATLGSIYSKLPDGSDRTGFTYRIYDINNVEITDPINEINAIKTVVDFEPIFDYEIIGGQLQQREKPSSDIRVWIVAAPDIPVNYGGSKEMIGGINLIYLDPADKINADGRVAKLIPYDPVYHSGKLRLILIHDAGVKHEFMLIFEMFRA
jgi:hypothetical protein